MADWIVAEPPCGYGRATTLDGQSKVAIGFTTYVLARARSCSPRRTSSASKASCRSGRAASIGARKAAAGGRDDDDGVPKHDREALLGWLRKPTEAQGDPEGRLVGPLSGVVFIPVPRCPWAASPMRLSATTRAAVGKNTHIRPDGCGAINTVKGNGLHNHGERPCFSAKRSTSRGSWWRLGGVFGHPGLPCPANRRRQKATRNFCRSRALATSSARNRCADISLRKAKLPRHLNDHRENRSRPGVAGDGGSGPSHARPRTDRGPR